jgi:O-succinylbenzoate synthase
MQTNQPRTVGKVARCRESLQQLIALSVLAVASGFEYSRLGTRKLPKVTKTLTRIHLQERQDSSQSGSRINKLAMYL